MNILLGTRLKRAREEIALSQGAFAKALGLSSEYISLLEAGKRTPSFETLLRIAEFLNKDVGHFFDESRPAFEGLFAGRDLDDRVRRELLKFKSYCEKYIQLEEDTGRRLDVAPAYSRISAGRLADEERRRLGLGDEPVRDIFGLCELNGCRIVRQPLPEEARIAGVFVFDGERKAAFALVNANEPPGLQIQIAAHLYAHYLKDRADGPIIDNPDVMVDEYVSLYPPREQFAQAFASRFLIPPAKLQAIVEKDLRSKGLTFEDVLFLKRYFGVSTRAMLRALRNHGHLTEVRFEEFFKRSPEDRESEVFGNATGQEERRPRTLFRKSRAVPSERYRLLAAEAASAAKDREGRTPAAPAQGESHE
jgi:transcriptional regulator with XRE-family HTH domain